MLIDELEETGFELARLSETTQNILRPYLAPWSEPRNPVDIMYSAISHGFKNIYQIALKALLEDPQVDAVICVCGYPTIKTIYQVAIKYKKPVLTWIIGQWEEGLLSRIRETGYRNVFSSPQRLARALDHSWRLNGQA
jgi:acetyltransferase